jgi:hypothetical protein
LKLAFQLAAELRESDDILMRLRPLAQLLTHQELRVHKIHCVLGRRQKTRMLLEVDLGGDSITASPSLPLIGAKLRC